MSIISNNISISIVSNHIRSKGGGGVSSSLSSGSYGNLIEILHNPNISLKHKIILNLPSDLKPGTWYSLQLTAHNGAGSRVVTTQFATLSITGDYFDDGDD